MEVIGSVYVEVSDRFQKGIIGGGSISRCVKAEKHDLGVIMAEIQEKRLGNIYSFDGGNYAGNVYDKECIPPTLKTMQGGNCQPMVVAMRGRNPDNPSDRAVGSPTEQRLEVNMQGMSNCLTSVQKDNLVLEKQGISTKGKQNDIASTILSGYERSNMTGFNADNAVIEKVGQISSDGSQCGTVVSDNGISANLVAGTHGYANSHIATQYRIRKLTPKECGRLMGVSDEDIDKMAAVNSNTQLYRQFGNSIVVQAMCAMFRNLNIQGIDRWEEMEVGNAKEIIE